MQLLNVFKGADTNCIVKAWMLYFLKEAVVVGTAGCIPATQLPAHSYLMPRNNNTQIVFV